MSRFTKPCISTIRRGISLALGLLLIPLTLTPDGVEETLVCGADGPEGSCLSAPNVFCESSGEMEQGKRRVN